MGRWVGGWIGPIYDHAMLYNAIKWGGGCKDSYTLTLVQIFFKFFLSHRDHISVCSSLF